MKNRNKILLLFLALSIVSFIVKYDSVNEKKVLEKVNLYVNNISKIHIEDNYYNCYGTIDELFTEEITPLHFNDINPNKTESTLNEYLRDIESSLGDNIVVEISEPIIYSCPYFDRLGDVRPYAIATCTKTININGNKRYYNLIIQIDLNDYKIFSVYSREKHMDLLPECSSKKLNKEEEEKQISIKKQIVEQAKDYLDKGNELFKVNDYIGAKRWYEAVLQILPNNLVAKERINDCNQLINSKIFIDRIESEIKNKNYSFALQLLQEIKDKNFVFEVDWHNERKQFCEIEIKKQKFNSFVLSGDYYFNNHMFDEAKKHYIKAFSLHIDDNMIQNKIKLCNEGNPNYVKNEIKKAYNNAVKSEKNWYDTFKTYLKYEKSGYLTGEHYYFMCLMMLENKKVARKMGYSKSLARSLSIEYYFKSKYLGCSKCDMAFLENQVFTNAIYKH